MLTLSRELRLGTSKSRLRVGEMNQRESENWSVGVLENFGTPTNPITLERIQDRDRNVPPPDPATRDWKIFTPPKQPRCRHNSRANIVFVDGHVESWKYEDLRNNKNDVFAFTDLFLAP